MNGLSLWSHIRQKFQTPSKKNPNVACGYTSSKNSDLHSYTPLSPARNALVLVHDMARLIITAVHSVLGLVCNSVANEFPWECDGSRSYSTQQVSFKRIFWSPINWTGFPKLQRTFTVIQYIYSKTLATTAPNILLRRDRKGRGKKVKWGNHVYCIARVSAICARQPLSQYAATSSTLL